MSAEPLSLLEVGPGRAIEEPVARALRELGCTQRALSVLSGIADPDLSNARKGRRPFGPHRLARLAEATGIDFEQPQYVFRCGLWLRNGCLDTEQRAALRAEVSRRRRQLTAGGYGGRHPEGEYVRREPSQRVGPSSGYIPLAYRSLLSPRAQRGLGEYEERTFGGDA